MQIGITHQEAAGTLGEAGAHELLDFAEIKIVVAELQPLQIRPVRHAMVDPGGDFTKLQIPAVKRGIDVRAEIRPEHRKRLAVKRAPAQRFHKQVDLIFGVEPARAQVRPRAPRQRLRHAKLGVVLGKTHRRPVNHVMGKPRVETAHGLGKIRLSLEFHKRLSGCG